MKETTALPNVSHAMQQGVVLFTRHDMKSLQDIAVILLREMHEQGA